MTRREVPVLIYVVDDHDLMRDATVIVIRHIRKNANVMDFPCFESFVKAVDDMGPPDVLVLDLRLPNIKEYEGIQKARTKCPNTKIIIYSASPATDCDDRCIASGADVYMEKSNSVQAFKKNLISFIGQA